MAEGKQGQKGDFATTEADKPQAKTEAVVKYVGRSDVRKISAADWKKAGVEDQNQVVWDASNRHTVKASELNAAALEVLKADGGFEIPES